jgi:tetratricopeptide (TPR) repeat protein
MQSNNRYRSSHVLCIIALAIAAAFPVWGDDDGDAKSYDFLIRQRNIHRELTARSSMPVSTSLSNEQQKLPEERQTEEKQPEQSRQQPQKEPASVNSGETALSAGPPAPPRESGPPPKPSQGPTPGPSAEPAPEPPPPEPSTEPPTKPPEAVAEVAEAEQPRIASVRSKTTMLEKDQVYAVLGDSVTVTLKGEGWIYLGEKDRKEGVTFLTRDSSAQSTDFLFHVERKNSYELAFQRQKSSTAETVVKQVGIEVVSREEFSRYIGTGAENSLYKPGDAEKADYSLAHRLFENERYEEALEEYKARYVPGNPEISPEIADRIASLSLTFDKYNDALRFWEQNRETEGEYSDKAVAGIITVAVALGDENLFHSYIEDFLSIEEIPVEKQHLEAARFAEKNELHSTAITLLEEFIDRYPGSRSVDLAYFTLGRMYEKKSSIQDVKQAINYYTIIIENFPASEYWIKAEERKEYLDRHYLHIR